MAVVNETSVFEPLKFCCMWNCSLSAQGPSFNIVRSFICL